MRRFPIILFKLLLLLNCFEVFKLQEGTVDDLEWRIVGGEDCSISDYPYMVSLQFPQTDLRHRCGGTLINSKYVLTAAHCFAIPFTLNHYTVVAGITNMQDIDEWLSPDRLFTIPENFNGQKRSIIRIVLHNLYSYEDDYNDIALIKLQKEIIQNDFIKFVRLPTQDQFKDTRLFFKYKSATVVGWGVQTVVDESEGPLPLNKKPSTLLQCVELPLIDNIECTHHLKSFTEYKVRATQFCTLYMEGGKDACQGDSGGPVISDNLQLGITSIGWGCGVARHPGVYTHVDAYINWIDAVVNNKGRLSFISNSKHVSGGSNDHKILIKLMLVVFVLQAKIYMCK